MTTDQAIETASDSAEPRTEARRKFVLDRSRWHRGKGPDGSRLLRACDGMMCCLGLYLEACGVPKLELQDRAYPPWAPALPTEAHWLSSKSTLPEEEGIDYLAWSTALATRNDNAALTEEERERFVSESFASNGIDVVFVDGPTPPEAT